MIYIIIDSQTAQPFEYPVKPDIDFVDVILDESSLVDISSSVHNGKLHWQAPCDYDSYTLFAVYERYTNQRSVDPIINATEIIGNGSWITDHFNAAGAQLVIDFWEQHMLDIEIKALLQAIGQSSKPRHCTQNK